MLNADDFINSINLSIKTIFTEINNNLEIKKNQDEEKIKNSAKCIDNELNITQNKKKTKIKENYNEVKIFNKDKKIKNNEKIKNKPRIKSPDLRQHVKDTTY